MTPRIELSFIFFFNDTATTEIYTLSLHDALPISRRSPLRRRAVARRSERRALARPESLTRKACARRGACGTSRRSEEHTSELQSRLHLVCRLLLEKKKTHHTTLRSHS